jgi:hypothetical protein
MDFPGEKLVIKLWETVAEKGIGGLFKPWQMRREGRASIDLKREEMLVIAQAECDAERIRRGEIVLESGNSSYFLPPSIDSWPNATDDSFGHQHLAQAASNLVIAETVRREANVTKALLHAESSLEDDPQTPPDASVDDDWLFRWRDSASQVSSEELQYLWGKLLAGEVKSPGTYSLRTLEFIRNLSQQEAEAISTLSQFVLGDRLIFREAKELLEEAEVNFEFLLNMQQLGILSGVEVLGFSFTLKSQDTSKYVQVLKSHSMVLVMTADDPNHTVSLPIYQISAIGQQVIGLGKFEPNIEYLRKVGEHLKSQGVKVELAQCVDVSPSQIRYFNAQQL